MTADTVEELVGKNPHLLSSGKQSTTSDVVSRLSGDEFAILITGIDHVDQVEALANKLIDAINQPFMIEAHGIETGISVGISMFPVDGVNAEELLGRADSAIYQAKKTGGNTCRFSPLPPPSD